MEPRTQEPHVAAWGGGDRLVRAATSIGSVLILGICITWHMAEVTYLSGPKKKPWEEHLEYLEHLGQIFESIDEPFIAAGDFNQRIPRFKGGNRQAAESLEATFAGLNIVTSGIPPGCTRPRASTTSPSAPSSRQAKSKAGPTTSPATGSAITTGSSPTSSHNGPEVAQSGAHVDIRIGVPTNPGTTAQNDVNTLALGVNSFVWSISLVISTGPGPVLIAI